MRDLIERIRRETNYDPSTGMLTWRVTRGKAKIGAQVGWVSSSGHRYAKIAGVETTYARFIWSHIFGEFPEQEVGHLNGDQTDFRTENLALRAAHSGAPLTAERLRELFFYDPDQGLFIRRKRQGHAMAGETAGSQKACGGIDICVDGKLYKAHRLAWLYVHGEWPGQDIDHKDRKRHNNVIGNLRPATNSQNLGNMGRPVTNTSGFKGVSWHKGAGKWQSHIKVEGINHYLGLFDTPEAAHAAYRTESQKQRGEFARWE